MRETTLVADSEMSVKFLRMQSSRVVIRMLDGCELDHFQTHRKGNPETPLSYEELSDMFRELTPPVIVRKVARHLLDQF